MNRLFTWLVVGAMVLGVLAGWLINVNFSAEQAKEVAGNLSIVTDIFLRLIKMIIAPLVFTTLVAGIAHMGDASEVGRVGVKTIFWFICASIVSLLLGLVMVHLLQPGVGLHQTADAGAASTAVDMSKFTLREFVTHLVPSSIFDAMARNEILQIVVFSVFVGTAVSAIDDRAPAVLTAVEQGAAIMLKVTGYVMKTAPLAIFAALAASIATRGIEVIFTYARFVGGFYLSLTILWGLLILAGVIIAGPRVLKLIGQIRAPTLLAFSTASSEAAYPRTLEELQKWG
ncbi:MAG: dicarboxylate/amino acid:cation symporter, partial [Phenylobacterium sp.]|nr:dicarboxylate/amino acid:cation symporter [Phenylobacterium sp.]